MLNLRKFRLGLKRLRSNVERQKIKENRKMGISRLTSERSMSKTNMLRAKDEDIKADVRGSILLPKGVVIVCRKHPSWEKNEPKPSSLRK